MTKNDGEFTRETLMFTMLCSASTKEWIQRSSWSYLTQLALDLVQRCIYSPSLVIQGRLQEALLTYFTQNTHRQTQLHRYLAKTRKTLKPLTALLLHTQLNVIDEASSRRKFPNKKPRKNLKISWIYFVPSAWYEQIIEHIWCFYCLFHVLYLW